MNLSDVIKAMAAAGCTTEQISSVAAAWEAAAPVNASTLRSRRRRARLASLPVEDATPYPLQSVASDVEDATPKALQSVAKRCMQRDPPPSSPPSPEKEKSPPNTPSKEKQTLSPSPTPTPISSLRSDMVRNSPHVDDNPVEQTTLFGEVLPAAEPKPLAKPTARAELEAVLTPEMAGEVIEHRNRLRKPLTPFAARLLANKFRLTPDPNAAATVMIEKGWQGFDPSWAGTDQPATIRGAKPNGPDNNTNLVSAVKRHQEILRRAEELGGTVEYGWRPDNSWGLNVILPET